MSNPESVLTFDGKDDHVNFGNKDIGGVFAAKSSVLTISVWIKPTKLNQTKSNHGTHNVFLARASDQKNDNFEMGVSPDGSLDVYIDENKDDITKTFGKGELKSGSWHFVGLVFDAGQITVYLDNNIYRGSFAGKALDNASGSPVTLGGTLHSDIFFQGQIAEMSLWKRVLSAQEIKKYLEQPLKGNETGLVAYWPLNEGNGTAIADQTGNNNNGKISGATWQQMERPIHKKQQTQTLTTGLEDYGRWKAMFKDHKRDPKEKPFRRGRIWC
ncbi:MAG: cyanobactin biosynthesis PatC/TenC/TruC family protein [Crocosphaera sp.]|nr:cyanobactin biosynthesis PatC/TenC/TruC family protein [Crocosphaera sp.]